MKRYQRGVTLIELMISLSIGLVMIGALIAVHLAQYQSTRQMEALSRLQENARYAFELMGYDIRMAGNWTCSIPGQSTPSNFVNNPTADWWRNTSRPLFGVSETADSNAEGDAGFPADFDAEALRGDTVMVLRADHDNPPGEVETYDPGTADIDLTENHTFNDGELLVLNDCKTQASVFQMTAGEGGDTIEHAITTPAPSPAQGNCSASLFGTTCATAPIATDVAGAKVMRLVGNAYYLRNSPRMYSNTSTPIPSLYRQALGNSGTTAATSAEELIDGVIDMQILYGEDTTADGSVDTYVEADGVANWANVIAVRVTLTLESTDENQSTTSQTFTFGNGATVTNNRLRRTFTATFGVRNRLN
jgi:type IV pilus assembly protein PilW